MCRLYEDHQAKHGYSSPDLLVAKMFTYMHRAYPGVGYDARAEAQNPDDGVHHNVAGAHDAARSGTRVTSPAHDNVDYGAFAPCPPSPGRGTVPRDGLDERVAGAPSNAAVRAVDPSRVVHETKTEETSVTEKIKSDGLYDDAVGTQFCTSQATEIISSNNSSAHGTICF